MAKNFGKWIAEEVPDLEGKTAVVTGANSGIGYITAREFARAGAKVFLACRNTEKAVFAKGEIEASVERANLEIIKLDLSSFDSIRLAVEMLKERVAVIDILVNNAGVMATPKLATKEGFELQLGTNHIGHFLLTSLLFDHLSKSDAARVVVVSSAVHAYGKIQKDDLQLRKNYQRWVAYSQSKLANLYFMRVLAVKLREQGIGNVMSVGAHPGYAATNLQTKSAKEENAWFTEWFMSLGNKLVAQSDEMGALPSIYAATGAAIENGAYYGPKGIWEFKGLPGRAKFAKSVQDMGLGLWLWGKTEELVGRSFFG